MAAPSEPPGELQSKLPSELQSKLRGSALCAPSEPPKLGASSTLSEHPLSELRSGASSSPSEPLSGLRSELQSGASRGLAPDVVQYLQQQERAAERAAKGNAKRAARWRIQRSERTV